MRLIDADKVKTTAREDCKDCIMNGSVYCKRECFINRVCDYIDAQPTSEERPQGEWVAAKNRFPDTEGEYLVSLDNGRIVVADDRSIIENHDFEPKMLAWQPLPEPYCGAQMEKEEEE